jgi:hypothetical protein
MILFYKNLQTLKQELIKFKTETLKLYLKKGEHYLQVFQVQELDQVLKKNQSKRNQNLQEF